MIRRILSIDWIALFLFALAAVPFALLMFVMSADTVAAIGVLFGCLLGYVVWSYLVVDRWQQFSGVFTPVGLGVLLLLGITGVVAVGWVPALFTAIVQLFALVMFVFFYWVIVLVAVYHYQRDITSYDPKPPYESISILIPAYNEEGYVEKTVSGLLAADYPDDKREIIVIDDGSDDGTFKEASSIDSEHVTAVRKENGGKYSALNYGLLFAEGDIVVVVDADSIVHPDALKKLVAPFDDESVGAVAGQVKVTNRGKLLTDLQRLEYIVGMNVYRRMLDFFGIVTIVPGCLGAFRRDVLEEVSAYDPDTLTEDFDLTLKILESGLTVRVSEAQVYTEVPDTWRDLYNQRLRWFRGNFMTVFKHANTIRKSNDSMLGRVALPIRLVEMFFVPFATWVILGVITWLLVQGAVVEVAALLVFFTSIIALITVFAIHVEGAAWYLPLYAPLFVLGYKHFLDAVMIKSLKDIVTGTSVEWTSAKRVLQREN